MKDAEDAMSKPFTSVVVKTPEGTTFMMNSTLPREQVKALAQNLLLASEPHLPIKRTQPDRK